jgi:diphosphomevalonate decarboxylase
MIAEAQSMIPEEGVVTENGKMSKEEVVGLKLRIESENNFPTASGVASSASGLSAVAGCLSKLYGLELSNERASIIARLGSGSACRSIDGGFVEWRCGFEHPSELESDPQLVSSKSFARQVMSEEEYRLGCLICVVDQEKKKVSSTEGMQ